MTPMRSLPAFTLIEVIVTLAIFTILISLVLPIATQEVFNYSLDNEQDTLVPLLDWTRDQAMSNVGQTNHGVKILPTQYVAYQGADYPSRTTSKDIVYARKQSVFGANNDIIFTALSGEATLKDPSGQPDTDGFVLSASFPERGRTFTLSVTKEGTIDWR